MPVSESSAVLILGTPFTWNTCSDRDWRLTAYDGAHLVRRMALYYHGGLMRLNAPHHGAITKLELRCAAAQRAIMTCPLRTSPVNPKSEATMREGCTSSGFE